MDRLVGKTLVFTDQHFGVKSNSPLRQRIGALAVKKLLDAIDKDCIQNIVFCGDYFHQRNALTVDTLNIAYKCLQALAKKCHVYMILGNHDLFNKNSTDVNSINIFRDNKQVIVVDSPLEIEINSKKALLVPWLSDLSGFNEESYDFLFGHFDISTKFLVSSYVQEHSKPKAASSSIALEINNDSSLNALDQHSSAAEEQLGDFIRLAKKTGTIFAGHIHQHKEMIVKGRKFIFVGTPYEQNLGDIGCSCGYYIIDENGEHHFIQIEGLPKHVQFKASDILVEGVDKFDFSSARGNIVQKVYDTDLPIEVDLKANQKIASFKPYEELLPDYQVQVDFTRAVDDMSHSSLVQMLKKSKFDYIRSYIEQLEDSALAAQSIEKSKLLNIMKPYYDAVTKD